MGEIKEPKEPIKPPVEETPLVVPSAEKTPEEERAEKIGQIVAAEFDDFVKNDLDLKLQRLFSGKNASPEEIAEFREGFLRDKEKVISEITYASAEEIATGAKVFDPEALKNKAHIDIWGKMLDTSRYEKGIWLGPTVNPLDGTEDTTRARAIGIHTIDKIDNFDQLNLTAEEEKGLSKKKKEEARDERIKVLARKLIDQFTVHGMGRGDTFQLRSDLDGRTCLKLLEKAGFKVTKENVEYVEQGETTKKDSSWVMDTSNRHGFVVEGLGKILITDHHDDELSGPDSSATKFIYDGLIEFGLLQDRLNKKEFEALDAYVKFVTKEDNKDYIDAEIKSIFDDYAHNLCGLQRYLSDDQLYKIFEDHVARQGKHFDPYKPLTEDYLKNFKYSEGGKKLTFTEAKKKAETSLRMSNEGIESLEKEGFAVDTGDSRFGKVLIDVGRDDKGTSKNRVGMKFTAARARDYGVYIEWSPETGYFSVQTANQMDFQTMQGKNIRGKYLLSGGRELYVSLREILGGLAGNPDYQIGEDLKTALKKNRKKIETKRKKERAEFIPNAQQQQWLDVLAEEAKEAKEYCDRENNSNEFLQIEVEDHVKARTLRLYREHLAGKIDLPEDSKENEAQIEAIIFYITEKAWKK